MHKPHFKFSLSCHLINPCKSELCKISKTILEKTNDALMESLNLNQVTSQLRFIKENSKCFFIQLDIKEFIFIQLDITEFICHATSFALEYTNLTENELRKIRRCCKSLLYNKNKSWNKKNTDSYFDVTMGNYERVEICELVENSSTKAIVVSMAMKV